jgi:rhamnosyltransferase
MTGKDSVPPQAEGPPPSASHAVVIPLFGADSCSAELQAYLSDLLAAGLAVVLVDNNPQPVLQGDLVPAGCQGLVNHNRGGIAGGLNRGIERALQLGARFLTLLDQDSRIAADQVARLREPLERQPPQRLVVGPSIWDAQRRERHGRWHPREDGLDATRLLISSGTTFRSEDWPELGRLHEDLCIDFVDHAWCFRAQARGFALVQHPAVRLHQQFGAVHPHPLCRRLGMQLYSPERHYTALRNLRWLCRQPSVPLDLKGKEVLKMAMKPWLWLLFEPDRRANLQAIVRGLRAPLPGPY